MSNAHNKDGKYRGIIDEIREQQRKMKDMTWKERFAYYWEYYKVHTIVTIVAIIAIVSGTAEKMAAAQYIAIFLACAGVIGLGFVEANEDDELRAARQEASNYKYAKSWLALALPIAYCILDAAGTFADDLVLETLNEDSANVAYELTFLAAGLVCGAYVLFVKREKLTPRTEAPKYIGAVCETIGQFFYI